MNKTESKLVRAEIRKLKSTLNKRQKQAAKEIAAHRKTIRSNEQAITRIESETTAFVRDTTDRVAILENRLNS